MRYRINRTGTLIEKRLRGLVVPKIGAAFIKSMLVIVDSLVAGRMIGMTALAAIAITSPIIAVDEMLHCLLAAGMSLQVANAVGEGDRRKTNRIVSATLIGVLVLYIAAFLPILIFLKPILSFFTDEAELVDMAFIYVVPQIIAFPIFELLLCLQRAYMIDGREKLFASRIVVTSMLNIILDILFVKVLQSGIIGLSFASIIATLVGYGVVPIHGFSKFCTIHPDFSIIRAPSEMFGYLKQNLLRGGNFAIDEGTMGLIDTFICRRLSALGGVAALATWGIYKRIHSVETSYNNEIISSTTLLGGALLSEGDTSGFRFVFKKAFLYVLSICTTAMIVSLVFAEQIASIMNIDANMVKECGRLLRFICPALIATDLLVFCEILFTVLKKYKFSYAINIMNKILIVLCVLVGAIFSAEGIFIGYATAGILAILIIWLYVRTNKDKFVPPKAGIYKLKDYSIALEPQQIMSASLDAESFITSMGASDVMAHYTALYLEDGCNMIRRYNENRKVLADIRLCIRDNTLMVTVVDNGKAYDNSQDENKKKARESIEKLVLLRLSDEVSRERILGMNHMVIKVDYRKLSRYDDVDAWIQEHAVLE